jgi:hypothetical protein
MERKPIKVEIVQESDKRILLKVYDDGTEERTPVIQTTKTKSARLRSYWCWTLRSGRRKFF